MPFDPVDRSNQVKGIVSFPQSDKYSVQLQRLLKRMFEVNPKKRPSMSDAFRYIENLQSKIQGISAQPKLKRRYSGFDAEDNKRDSSEEESKKYKTAHDQDDFDNDQDHQADGEPKEFAGFGTKIEKSASKNGTKGWVLYATENSNFPPRIQYISKLVLKAWRKQNKTHRFYEYIYERGFEQNTIIALKSLCLIHKYIL